MERRQLPNLIDHNDDLGAFATKWEGWVDVSTKFIDKRARINVTHPDDIDRIADERGVYAVMCQPSRVSRYVAYIGYSKSLSTELKIRYGGWEKRDRFMAARSHYPFAAVYVTKEADARFYEDYLIRYYCPPWNTRFHR